MFDAKTARKQLSQYEKKGARGQTLKLLDALHQLLTDNRQPQFTHLDIGGGVGVLQHELAKLGSTRTTAVDASAPYLGLLQQAAKKRGYADRLICLEGDFIDVAMDTLPSTVVTLDKVICCYPDMPTLVSSSAKKAKLLYGIILPHDTRLIRWGTRLVNWLVRNLLRKQFQAFVHSHAAIDRIVEAEGLQLAQEIPGFLMCVKIYQRPPQG